MMYTESFQFFVQNTNGMCMFVCTRACVFGHPTLLHEGERTLGCINLLATKSDCHSAKCLKKTKVEFAYWRYFPNLLEKSYFLPRSLFSLNLKCHQIKAHPYARDAKM